MKNEIEIKRKTFEVIEQIGERSYKVTRKGKIYFLKKFSGDDKGFSSYVSTNHKCSVNGVSVPKIYMYDKSSLTIVSEFIETKNVFEILLKEDLSDEIFEQAFFQNLRCKMGKFCIDFEPINFGFDGKKIYYLSDICRDFNEKYFLEKQSIFLWFYTPEFVKYLIGKGYTPNTTRSNVPQGELNKKISLTVIKNFR